MMDLLMEAQADGKQVADAMKAHTSHRAIDPTDEDTTAYVNALVQARKKNQLKARGAPSYEEWLHRKEDPSAITAPAPTSRRQKTLVRLRH